MDVPASENRMDPRVADLLTRLAQAVGTAREPGTIFRSLKEFLAETVPFHAVLISEYEPETRLRRLVYSASRDTEIDVADVPPLGPTGSPHAVAVETGEIIVVDDLQKAIEGRPAIEFGDERVCRSAIAVPMEVRGRVIGGFEIQAEPPAAFDEQDEVVLHLAANLAATAIESVRLLDRERELRERAEAASRRFEDLVGGLDAVVWEAIVEDAEEAPDFLRFTFVSGQVESMLGYPPERWVEEPGFWSSIIHPEDREAAVRRCREATRRGEDHDLEYRVVRADERIRHVRELVRVDPTGDGSPRLRGILVDETETKRLEGQLLEAGKMEVVGRLAGGIAHDFNNLLTVIRGNVDLLVDERSPDDPALEALGEIREAATRAAALVRQLLAFSRQRPDRVRNLSIRRSVEEVSGMLRRLIGKDVEIEFDFDPDPGTIRADPTRVEQAIVNLVVNARDAMPEGGRIEIAVHREAEEVTLSVSDEGVGMDEQTRAHLFEPFFTTKQEGTGLGLSSVYAIVTGAGGSIDVESEPGAGTTVTLRWPVSDAPADLPMTAAAGTREVPAGSGETILLVEDEPGVRRLARRVLEGAGYRVSGASDGEAAIERLDRSGERPDLLLSDVVMPRVDGRELAARLRERWPDLPVLLMSGYEEETRSGAPDDDPVLDKPFRPDDLLVRVREVLERGSRGPTG